MLIIYSSMKTIKSLAASAIFIIAIFILLHFVIIMEIETVKNITKRIKMSFLLNRCLNI